MPDTSFLPKPLRNVVALLSGIVALIAIGATAAFAIPTYIKSKVVEVTTVEELRLSKGLETRLFEGFRQLETKIDDRFDLLERRCR
jgi:hypothetical protein